MLLLVTSNQQKIRKYSAWFCILFLPCCKQKSSILKVSLTLEGKTMLSNEQLILFWQNSGANGKLGQNTGEDCLTSLISAICVKNLAEIQRCSYILKSAQAVCLATGWPDKFLVRPVLAEQEEV